MLADENTQLVQRFYEKFQAGDVDALITLLDAGVEWQVPAMDNVPFAGTWKGREGIARFFKTLSDTHEVVQFRLEQCIAQDSVVVALGRFVMRVRATGHEFVSDWAHVFTIDAGKVAHFREFVDTAAVIRAQRAS